MKNKRMAVGKAKRIAVCAMLASLGVVLMSLGTLIDVLDLSAAVLASFLCAIAVIEYGGASPWLVFFVTSVLALLLPNKLPAIEYLLFFGYYPIFKEKIERMEKWLSWLFKELVFNAALVIVFFASKLLLYKDVEISVGWLVLGAALAEATFVLYDVALTRLIKLYLFKLRKIFKIK